ncbi:MAG: tetratricopeptide repeat protein, partial [Ignavibacteria bacterium]|nr:tetratricopeptide repeat protein [Ignavibacteria bacterium]
MVGEAVESLKYYQKAESMLLSQADRDEVLFGMLSINIGNAFQLRGDFDKALLYYQNALNSFSKKLPKGHANLNTAANNIAFAYNQIGEFDKSISISLKNIDLQLTSVSRVRLYRNIARSYIGLKNNPHAEVYFKMAIKSSEDLFGKKHYEYGVSLKDYAVYLSNTLRFADAVKNFENALVVYQSVFGQNDTEVADVIRNIAYCKTRLKQFDEAEKLFFNAESILNNFESSQNNAEIQDLTSIRLTDLYFDFGNLFYLWYLDTKNTNYLKKSFQQLEKAVNLLDGLGVSLSDESRMQLSENVRTRFAMAIEVAYQLYKLTDDHTYAAAAFAYSGKSKAAVLLSSVKKLQAFTSAGVPEEILNLERKLREDIQAIRKINYEERQKTVPNQGRISFLETRQYTMVRKYDSLLKQIEIGFPEYYSLRYNTGVIKMEELQHKLKNDEVLLEY